MSVSNRPDHFFQTTSSLAESDRKARKSANTQGYPIKFPTKLLSVDVNYYYDAGGNVVFVAEAGGAVTGLHLSTNESSTAPTGPQAPLTSLAFYEERSDSDPFKTLKTYAGCWDKSIWVYTSQVEDPNTRKVVTDVTSFTAHTDFVKCLLIAQTPDKQNVIISGGADGDVRFWTPDGKSLGFLKLQSRSIECLVIDPFAPVETPLIFVSTSQREIFQIPLPGSTKLNTNNIKTSEPIVAHETSVYKLYFDSDGDLWTASADKTAKHLLRESGWKSDTVLVHPDFVRDVVTHDKYGWVITACRDEEVRVWNRGTGTLHHIFSGHFEEVTGLALSNDLVISVSIDATLRRWSLAPTDLQKAVEEAKHPNLLEQQPEPDTDLGMLTAEEEAELRAMMEEEEQSTLERMALDEQ